MKAPAAVASLQPLIARGEELRNAEPIVAYFCFYSAVQQVLATKLHTTDSEVADFAANLMSELEEMKSSGLSSPDAKDILDSDDASRAYVLNFAVNVFHKAQTAVDQLKTSKATAATFIAASTFLSLETVWGPLSPETSDKIKYSKYQATRILTAIKKGEDPNEQFRLEAAEREEQAAAQAANGDPNQPEELEQLEQSLDRPTGPPTGPPTGHAIDQSIEPEEHNNQEDVALEAGNDLALPAAPDADPAKDLELPGPPREDLDNDLALPQAPGDQPEGNISSPAVPPKHPPQPPAPSSNGSPVVRTTHAAPRPVKPSAPVKSVSQAAPKASASQRQSPSEILELANATSSAQKHAKYAISALNYDDIKTAVGELEAALAVLRLYEQGEGA